MERSDRKAGCFDTGAQEQIQKQDTETKLLREMPVEPSKVGNMAENMEWQPPQTVIPTASLSNVI